MILTRFCEDDVDEDVKFIRNVMFAGEWEIALFKEGDEIKTGEFTGYHLEFYNSGKVLAEGNGRLVKGSWLVIRDEGKLQMELNFGDDELFEEFNEDWIIANITENRIELHDLDDTGNVKDKLVLERL